MHWRVNEGLKRGFRPVNQTCWRACGKKSNENNWTLLHIVKTIILMTMMTMSHWQEPIIKACFHPLFSNLNPPITCRCSSCTQACRLLESITAFLVWQLTVLPLCLQLITFPGHLASGLNGWCAWLVTRESGVQSSSGPATCWQQLIVIYFKQFINISFWPSLPPASDSLCHEMCRKPEQQQRFNDTWRNYELHRKALSVTIRNTMLFATMWPQIMLSGCTQALGTAGTWCVTLAEYWHIVSSTTIKISLMGHCVDVSFCMSDCEKIVFCFSKMTNKTDLIFNVNWLLI